MRKKRKFATQGGSKRDSQGTSPLSGCGQSPPQPSSLSAEQRLLRTYPARSNTGNARRRITESPLKYRACTPDRARRFRIPAGPGRRSAGGRRAGTESSFIQTSAPYILLPASRSGSRAPNTHKPPPSPDFLSIPLPLVESAGLGYTFCSQSNNRREKRENQLV